jgi:hypothetical protein
MRSVYYSKNPAVYISTFKQAMSLIRKHPECSISLVRSTTRIQGTCIYFNGEFHAKPLTHKQIKYIKANFKDAYFAPDRSRPKNSKYQKRKRKLAFLRKWNSWDYNRQCSYLDTTANAERKFLICQNHSYASKDYEYFTNLVLTSRGLKLKDEPIPITS